MTKPVSTTRVNILSRFSEDKCGYLVHTMIHQIAAAYAGYCHALDALTTFSHCSKPASEMAFHEKLQ